MAMCLLGVCQARDSVAKLPSPNSFRVGDTWSYSFVWTKNGSVVQQSDNYRHLRVDEVRAKTVLFTEGDLDWVLVRTPSQSSATLGYGMKQSQWRQWPLYVGRKWRFWDDQQLPDSRITSSFQDAEVAAFEEVSVPAGRFMAFRIEYRGAVASTDSKRLPKIAKDGSGGVKGDRAISETHWYAPLVFMDVKSVYRTEGGEQVVELKSYVRGQKR